VVVRLRVERLDERDVVHVLGDVGVSVAHPGPGLAVLAELERRLHQRAGAAVEYVDLDPLAVVSLQLRLPVEQVHAAGGALHE
jgi:hypothetical protein